MQFKTEIEFNDDPALAPKQVKLLAFMDNGVTFMRLDSVGQWRNMVGTPKKTPQLWAIAPKDPRK